ncbi:hypothetical protein TRFO_12175 [Tritrichomonas foetus]|uniref:Nucleotide-diphospho-sugar transferase domain-containing protein n=1 Tax=Tritrichomonas foetus TaxID=1144522 RepID=A0A1J4J4B4_9EUKA|nr:hypothetical protein TRFO_12175 [Tritrichomonas foetus]|eukprot:OHS92983.1 hypothetical protein TRFO_12175 [Tritrichomonas foetus]
MTNTKLSKQNHATFLKIIYIISCSCMILFCTCNLYHIGNFFFSNRIDFAIIDKFFNLLHGSLNNNNKSNSSEYYMCCVPYLPKKSFSSRKDLVITTLLRNETEYFLLNLFSIRQSGCNATIVIIYNDEIVFSSNAIKMMNNFDVQTFSISLTSTLKAQSLENVHNSLIRSFLNKHHKEFERVMSFTIENVFFENDPFEYFVGDYLYLFQESLVKMKNCNRSFINEFTIRWSSYDDMMETKTIVGSGIFAGSMNQMERFYDRYASKDIRESNPYADGQINGLFYRNILDVSAIPYLLHNHFGPVHSLKDDNKSYDYYFDNKNYLYVKNLADRVANVLYQTEEDPLVLNGLVNRCNVDRFLFQTPEISKSIVNDHEYSFNYSYYFN